MEDLVVPGDAFLIRFVIGFLGMLFSLLDHFFLKSFRRRYGESRIKEGLGAAFSKMGWPYLYVYDLSDYYSATGKNKHTRWQIIGSPSACETSIDSERPFSRH